MKKNIKVGKTKFYLFIFLVISFLNFYFVSRANSNLEGSFIEIKVLDKISSKNTLVKIKNGDEIKHQDLSIKSIKCKNSEFDDNPEITAYIQVKDLTINQNEQVFIFNGWTFASDPSLTPFDHAIYDLQLLECYSI